MENSKIVGILIIVVLILSIGIIGYNATINVYKHSGDTSETILEDSQLSQITDNETTSSAIKTINLNIHQKTGATEIEFADTDDVYKITTNGQFNTTTNVTYSENGDVLNIDINSDEDENTIVLSNKYVYNINETSTYGGFSINVNNKARINTLNTNITMGGVNVEFNGGSLTTFNNQINTGGVNIEGTPSGETNINSNIVIGGFNAKIGQVGHVFTTTDLGGSNLDGYQTISDMEYKGVDFDNSQNKITITSKIQIGGLNIE
ncbi:hypothetical protein [Methanosphaera sp. WGK6]|uniref:hypothetical protein n=1 Tax=Methanosphaera sp. WGK6 TaxID=1561964 RepID=UPI00084C094E|nr:hypothetical protein [Methanosphaera sp. WGK6]OED30139.1 hypothetical protein NL43_04345 [Methanosphaera sp. WGK6]